MYLLTRDDGFELRLSGGIWEQALELAYFHGWKPAGTESPRNGTWATRPSRAPTWDGRDYFSFRSQRVASTDAHALGEAVGRALETIADRQTRTVVHTGADQPSPLPTRASARASGVTGRIREILERLSTFARRGGFTIGGAD